MNHFFFQSVVDLFSFFRKEFCKCFAKSLRWFVCRTGCGISVKKRVYYFEHRLCVSLIEYSLEIVLLCLVNQSFTLFLCSTYIKWSHFSLDDFHFRSYFRRSLWASCKVLSYHGWRSLSLRVEHISGACLSRVSLMDLSYIDVRLFTSECSSEMINCGDKSASNDLTSILWSIRFLTTVFSAFVLFCNTLQCIIWRSERRGPTSQSAIISSSSREIMRSKVLPCLCVAPVTCWW